MDVSLLIAVLLFATGLAGLIIRRSLLVGLLSLNLSFAGGALAFVRFGARNGSHEGVGLAVLLLSLGALWSVVGASTAIAVYRRRGTVNLDELRELRG